jgi:NAD(P)-dependent dehydrogenase (short-subunit alcohol dehydrogenase family)
MDLKLAGKTALVTGASEGIGRGLARAFAEEGVNLHLTARNTARLEELRNETGAEFDVNVALHPLDLAERGACARLADAVGDVDILVNNAGAIPSGTLFEIGEQAWRDGWELKVMAYVDLTRIYYQKMKANGGGVIVNNIGNSGEIFDPRYIAGSAGNASLMAFTRALGGHSLADNIRVVGINPGPVDTDRIYTMLKKRAADVLGDEDRYEELLERYPLNRPAHVHEITDLIVFLTSFRSGYTSGVIFTVDGGISSRRSII